MRRSFVCLVASRRNISLGQKPGCDNKSVNVSMSVSIGVNVSVVVQLGVDVGVSFSVGVIKGLGVDVM